MIVPVEIPDLFAKQFRLDEADRSRELFEAFVLQRFAEGELTTSQVGAALGLSFSETEQFLHDHGAPPNLGPEEHVDGLKNLKELLPR
jgi:predicted HTH domain antitoxin